MSSAYLRLLIFLLAISIPACASFSPVFLMALEDQSEKLAKELTKYIESINEFTKAISEIASDDFMENIDTNMALNGKQQVIFRRIQEKFKDVNRDKLILVDENGVSKFNFKLIDNLRTCIESSRELNESKKTELTEKLYENIKQLIEGIIDKSITRTTEDKKAVEVMKCKVFLEQAYEFINQESDNIQRIIGDLDLEIENKSEEVEIDKYVELNKNFNKNYGNKLVVLSNSLKDLDQQIGKTVKQMKSIYKNDINFITVEGKKSFVPTPSFHNALRSYIEKCNKYIELITNTGIKIDTDTQKLTPPDYYKYLRDDNKKSFDGTFKQITDQYSPHQQACKMFNDLYEKKIKPIMKDEKESVAMYRDLVTDLQSKQTDLEKELLETKQQLDEYGLLIEQQNALIESNEQTAEIALKYAAMQNEYNEKYKELEEKYNDLVQISEELNTMVANVSKERDVKINKINEITAKLNTALIENGELNNKVTDLNKDVTDITTRFNKLKKQIHSTGFMKLLNNLDVLVRSGTSDASFPADFPHKFYYYRIDAGGNVHRVNNKTDVNVIYNRGFKIVFINPKLISHVYIYDKECSSAAFNANINDILDTFVGKFKPEVVISSDVASNVKHIQLLYELATNSNAVAHAIANNPTVVMSGGMFVEKKFIHQSREEKDKTNKLCNYLSTIGSIPNFYWLAGESDDYSFIDPSMSDASGKTTVSFELWPTNSSMSLLYGPCVFNIFHRIDNVKYDPDLYSNGFTGIDLKPVYNYLFVGYDDKANTINGEILGNDRVNEYLSNDMVYIDNERSMRLPIAVSINSIRPIESNGQLIFPEGTVDRRYTLKQFEGNNPRSAVTNSVQGSTKWEHKAFVVDAVHNPNTPIKVIDNENELMKHSYEYIHESEVKKSEDPVYNRIISTNHRRAYAECMLLSGGDIKIKSLIFIFILITILIIMIIVIVIVIVTRKQNKSTNGLGSS